MKSPKTIKPVTAFGAFALFVILAPLASAQGKQDFTLYNRTGQAITEMYVSPASADEWGDDILGIDTLASGRRHDNPFLISRASRVLGHQAHRRERQRAHPV